VWVLPFPACGSLPLWRGSAGRPHARPRRTQQPPTRCRFSLRCRQVDLDDQLHGRRSLPASGGLAARSCQALSDRAASLLAKRRPPVNLNPVSRWQVPTLRAHIANEVGEGDELPQLKLHPFPRGPTLLSPRRVPPLGALCLLAVLPIAGALRLWFCVPRRLPWAPSALIARLALGLSACG
jgi:hypothetical protein